MSHHPGNGKEAHFNTQEEKHEFAKAGLGTAGDLQRTKQWNTLVPISSLSLKSKKVGVQRTGCVGLGSGIPGSGQY